ncbi:hypothetical protein AB0J63_01870 [Streptosporangium canum]|uniref:hypothetical protein n=1 Tax=Streptosporangium canum TaxID=324952 RepID=UPI003414BB3D
MIVASNGSMADTTWICRNGFFGAVEGEKSINSVRPLWRYRIRLFWAAARPVKN